MSDADDTGVPLPPWRTPCCGRVSEEATEVRGERIAPRAGDFAVCAWCGIWLRFISDDGATRCAVDEDLCDLSVREIIELTAASHLVRQETMPKGIG